MNRAQRSLCRALLLCCIVSGYASPGFGQASDPKSSAVVDQIMATALARCYSKGTDGFKRISFVPATNEEFAQVKALGQQAIVPLARYVDLRPQNGFTQLFAVKFLMVIGGPPTLGPLKRALAQDQWDVTRAAAPDGIFQVSPAQAKPYVEAALGDKSQLVRQRAHHLSSLYQEQSKWPVVAAVRLAQKGAQLETRTIAAPQQGSPFVYSSAGRSANEEMQYEA